MEELALWTVLTTIKRPLISFEGWKLGDDLWGKCGSRHSIKPSSSGDCVRKLFVLAQYVLYVSTVFALEKRT